MIGLLLVVATACALVAVARQVPAEAIRARPAPTLPVTPAAEVPVCPGPETLEVPDGARAVPVPGPIAIAGVAALPSALGQPSSVDALPGRAAHPPAAPKADLAPLGAARRPVPGPAATAAAPAGPPATVPAATPPAGADAGPAVRVVGAQPRGRGAWRLDVRRGGSVPVVAATQWTLATSGDMRGLATTACAPAATDTWLLGGGTQPGHRLRLLLANPGASPSVVDVTLLGPQGVVQAPAGNDITVGPGAQKALYLDALAPGLAALAVHVEARSGRVAATLHDSLLRGLVPGGADDVPPAAPPSRHQVVPGLAIGAPVPGAGGPGGAASEPATAPGAVAVRVAAPGGSEAVVRVHLLGPDGEVNLPEGGVATVPPRTVVDLPVTGVPAGTYAAVVDADAPVVASALIGRSRAGSQAAGAPAAAPGTAPPAELAWAAGARALQATTAIALPAASAPVRSPGARPGAVPPVTARVALAAPGSAGRVVLAEVGEDGSPGTPRAVDIPAGHSVGVDLDADSVGVLLRADSGAGPVAGALVLTSQDASGELISVQTLRPGAKNTGRAPSAVQDLRVGLAPA